MKAFRFLSIAVFCALLMSAIAASAQEPQQQEERRDQAKPPEQQEPRREEARPTRPQDEKPPKREEAKPPKKEQHEEQAKPSHEQQPAQQAQHARPAAKSGHIPDNKFRASFGRQHTFVINRPVIVQGQPQFVFAGYTFVLLDPWPTEWLYTDDCYIDYVDGDYFLFDVLHPGIRIALFVQM